MQLDPESDRRKVLILLDDFHQTTKLVAKNLQLDFQSQSDFTELNSPQFSEVPEVAFQFMYLFDLIEMEYSLFLIGSSGRDDLEVREKLLKSDIAMIYMVNEYFDI